MDLSNILMVSDKIFVIKFTAVIWLYPSAKAAWHFVSLPTEYFTDIKRRAISLRGIVKVDAKIGNTNWTTSIFMDKKNATYLLPLKQSVRKQENLLKGHEVEIEIFIARKSILYL